MTYRINIFLVLAVAGLFIVAPALAGKRPEKTLAGAVGQGDAIVIRNMATGDALFSGKGDSPMVPASIIKLVTSLAAFHYLGRDFRFVTECYQRPDGALLLKGYGDPALVSEEMSLLAEAVSRLVRQASDIVVDHSFFQSPVDIPGRNPDSLEPYDAPNGALCLNYNTVFFKNENGRPVSAEPQTPLLPLAVAQIRSTAAPPGRRMVIRDQGQAARYAGEMFAYCLADRGCRVTGQVTEGRVDPATDRLVYTYVSRHDLAAVVTLLLRFSNNFTANQLLLCCGAKKFGPPATLAKGLAAVGDYLQQELKINDIILVEGSGLSVDNRVSAGTMSLVLTAFSPYRTLMRPQDGQEYYKTGNLTGVSTRAGFLETSSGGLYGYVMMSNKPGRDVGRLMPAVRELVRRADFP